MDNFDDDKLADNDTMDAMNAEYNCVKARQELLLDTNDNDRANPSICMAELDVLSSAYIIQKDILDRLIYLAMLARGPRTQDSINRAIIVKKKALQLCTALIEQYGGCLPQYSKAKIGSPTFHVLLEDINYLEVQLLSTLEESFNLISITSCEQTSAIMLHYISY